MFKKETIPITRYHKEEIIYTNDVVVIEEPLEIFIDGKPNYMTMRMPGEEMALALGYCFTEGIIDSMKDVHFVHYCAENAGNRVEVALDPKRKGSKASAIKGRTLAAYSSCGLCGKELVEDIRVKLSRRHTSFAVPASAIDGMMGVIEKQQHVFGDTGATHAAAIFDRGCELLAFSEDLGRHNAIDKAMGRLLAEGAIEKAMVVVATSRLSYEMVQKVGRSSAEVLIGMSPPTSLGIDLARSINLTLIGFARKGRGNVYTGEERIIQNFGVKQ